MVRLFNGCLVFAECHGVPGLRAVVLFLLWVCLLSIFIGNGHRPIIEGCDIPHDDVYHTRDRWQLRRIHRRARVGIVQTAVSFQFTEALANLSKASQRGVPRVKRQESRTWQLPHANFMLLTSFDSRRSTVQLATQPRLPPDSHKGTL